MTYRTLPGLALALLLAATCAGSCLCPGPPEDYWGEWTVVESSHSEVPAWATEPAAKSVIGEGFAYKRSTAQDRADRDIVENAAALLGVHVTSKAVRHDTESSSMFRETTVLRVNSDLSVDVSDIYWAERIRVGIQLGKAAHTREFRFLLQGQVTRGR